MFCIHCGAKIQENAVFCTNCGKSINKIQNADISAPLPNDPKFKTQKSPVKEELIQENDNTVDMRKIIGKNVAYYLSQFESLQKSDPCNWNWGAFCLGLFHAGYRGVWKEWLRFMKIPLIAVGGDLLIVVLGMFTGSYMLLTIGTISALLAGILSCVWQLYRYPKQFNRIYYEHVLKKLRSGDNRQDPSFARVVVTVLLCIGLSFALSLITTFSTFSMSGAYEEAPMAKMVEPTETVPEFTAPVAQGEFNYQFPQEGDLNGNSFLDFLNQEFPNATNWISGTDVDCTWFTIEKNDYGGYSFTLYEDGMIFYETNVPVEIVFDSGKTYGSVWLTDYTDELCCIDIYYDDSGDMPILTLFYNFEDIEGITCDYYCEYLLPY